MSHTLLVLENIIHYYFTNFGSFRRQLVSDYCISLVTKSFYFDYYNKHDSKNIGDSITYSFADFVLVIAKVDVVNNFTAAIFAKLAHFLNLHNIIKLEK